MVIKTKIFGEVDIDESKIITFTNGIVGFPDLTEFALVHDEEKGNGAGIRWMQSLQEPVFAMPVMDPLYVIREYNPEVEDELLKSLGKMNPETTLVLVTVTVPSDITKMSVNLKAPIVINATARKACQVITDGGDYAIKYPIYQILQDVKNQSEKAGE